MKNRIQKLLLCGLFIAGMLVLAFIAGSSLPKRTADQVLLLYEPAPAADRSLHREEDFDPAGKRVIWQNEDGRLTTDDFVHVSGKLTLAGSLGATVRQPCNENAWFSVTLQQYGAPVLEEQVLALRRKGAYVSLDGDTIVGFMTGSQILSLGNSKEEVYVWLRSRPIEKYQAELSATNQPLETASVTETSSFRWHWEYFQNQYHSPLGSNDYTGPVFHISAKAELKLALDDGRVNAAQARRWRDSYTGEFFLDHDLIVYQVAYPQGEDLVPLRLERAGTELRMILTRASDLKISHGTLILLAEVPKDLTQGADTLSLRIGDPQEPLQSADDLWTVTELDTESFRVMEPAFRLLGPDLRSFVNIPRTEVRDRYLEQILAQRWLTDEQRQMILSEWKSRYTEEFLHNRWVVIWQVDLPGRCSGTAVEKALLVDYDHDLKAANGMKPLLEGSHYEIYLRSGKSDPDNGAETALVIMKLPLNMITDFDIYLDGVKVDTNRYKWDVTVTGP